MILIILSRGSRAAGGGGGDFILYTFGCCLLESGEANQNVHFETIYVRKVQVLAGYYMDPCLHLTTTSMFSRHGKITYLLALDFLFFILILLRATSDFLYIYILFWFVFVISLLKGLSRVWGCIFDTATGNSRGCMLPV